MQINFNGRQLNVVSGKSSIQVQDNRASKSNKEKTYRAYKKDKNYIVNGSNGTLERNIHVKGNIVLNGMKHIVLSGGYDRNLKDLIIEGDLIIHGSNHDITNIVQLDGQVIDNSYGSIIN